MSAPGTPAGAPQPTPSPATTITVFADGQTIELRDDGLSGDETAGDGRYTGSLIFQNSGSVPVALRALIGGAELVSEGRVEVYGLYTYRGGPVELNLGSLRENGESCQPWIPVADQRGNVPVRLHLLRALPPGHRLTLRSGGMILKTDEGQISLPPLTRMEICLTTNGRAASSDAHGEPWLRVSINEPSPQAIELRLKWHVDGLPFWRRWLWMFELLLGLALLFFAIYGYIKPHRFPRGFAIAFVPEYDELDQTPQPLSQWRGVRIGFYRDARAGLQPSYRVTGHTKGAIAILKATADGVWVMPSGGAQLFREVDPTEWREVPPEGQAGRRGLVYRIGERGPYFRMASRL